MSFVLPSQPLARARRCTSNLRPPGDNAPSDSFFNSLKNERVRGTSYATRADAMADLFERIEVFYNRRRRHSTLGYRSPVRLLENWISKHAAQQSVAA